MAKTIFEAYNFTKKELNAAGIEDYGFEARQIIRRITGLSNAQILEHYANKLTEFQENNLIAMLKQRKARYPLQYMLGVWDFYGREFFVGPGVLIPRADTEVLVETAIGLIKDTENAEVLDLCAGSGCIGITIAAENKTAQVTAVEKYREALTYLEKNIKHNSVDNITALEGDIFESAAADRKYDIIVSNPPYIPADEMEDTSPEVKFEPQTALYGGEDGLVFYRAIAENYKKALKAGGKLCFEIGIHEEKAVAEILEEQGFTDIEIKKDYNGIDRVVFGTVGDVK